jgi:quercetin dioxygenase-like cupin family protein
MHTPAYVPGYGGARWQPLERKLIDSFTSPCERTTAMTGPQLSRPFAVPPGQSNLLWTLNTLTAIKASSTQTGGTFGLIEMWLDENSAPPAHVHHGEDESFYVLAGELTLYIGDETFKASTGAFVFAPRGIPHRFTVNSPDARILILISPGGLEQFFIEVGEPAAQADLPKPSPVKYRAGSAGS